MTTDSSAIVYGADPLAEASAHLEAQQPEEAFEILKQASRSDPAVRNARAVCLLRLGRPEEAIADLNPIVLTGTPLSCDRNAAPEILANFVAGIALRGDPLQALSLLHDVPDQAHPAVAQLREGLRAWRRSVPLWQWPLMVVGRYPSTPLRFDFTPGWLLPRSTSAAASSFDAVATPPEPGLAETVADHVAR